ncbi:unnamed protein product, partial [Symbiodinium pilosum]
MAASEPQPTNGEVPKNFEGLQPAKHAEDPGSEPDSFAEEEVEDLRKALPVRPGHLWNGESPEPDACDAWEVQADVGLAALLERHHKVLQGRFDQQDELLRQLLLSLGQQLWSL